MEAYGCRRPNILYRGWEKKVWPYQHSPYRTPTTRSQTTYERLFGRLTKQYTEEGRILYQLEEQDSEQDPVIKTDPKTFFLSSCTKLLIQIVFEEICSRPKIKYTLTSSNTVPATPTHTTVVAADEVSTPSGERSSSSGERLLEPLTANKAPCRTIR